MSKNCWKCWRLVGNTNYYTFDVVHIVTGVNTHNGRRKFPSPMPVKRSGRRHMCPICWDNSSKYHPLVYRFGYSFHRVSKPCWKCGVSTIGHNHYMIDIIQMMNVVEVPIGTNPSVDDPGIMRSSGITYCCMDCWTETKYGVPLTDTYITSSIVKLRSEYELMETDEYRTFDSLFEE